MTRIDSSGAGLEYSGFPYKEGDDYYTIEGSQVVWSCWDCESEAMYTEAKAKGKPKLYFDFEGDAQRQMFIKLKEEFDNQHLDVRKATDIARCCIVGDGEEVRIAEYLKDGTCGAVLSALTRLPTDRDWVDTDAVYNRLDKLVWTKTPFIWNKYLLSKDQETWIAVVTGLDTDDYVDTWYQNREKTSRCLKVTLCAERECPEGEWVVKRGGRHHIPSLFQRYEDAVEEYERMVKGEEDRPLTGLYLLDHLRRLEREDPSILNKPVTIWVNHDELHMRHSVGDDPMRFWLSVSERTAAALRTLPLGQNHEKT